MITIHQPNIFNIFFIFMLSCIIIISNQNIQDTMIPSNVRSSVAYSVHAKISFRVIVVGDIAVGKTSLIIKYVKGTFNKNYIVSLGIEFYSKMI